MSLQDEFVAIFGVWEEARPYLHLIVDEREMGLVVAMQGRAVTADEAADLLAISRVEAADLLQRGYARCVLNKTVEAGVTRFAPAEFGARLDHFAKYENWDDIPAKDRRAIDHRFLAEFTAKHRPDVQRKMQGLSLPSTASRSTWRRSTPRGGAGCGSPR